MTDLSRRAASELTKMDEILEDDDDVDTGVLRIRYEKSMERLAATRLEIAKIKRNIPAPEKT